jgi:hypothetical protein
MADSDDSAPRGAFLLMLLFLMLIVLLWTNVYLQIWQRG